MGLSRDFFDIIIRISEDLSFIDRKKWENGDHLTVRDSQSCFDNHFILSHLCTFLCVRERERDTINLCLLIFWPDCTSFPHRVVFFVRTNSNQSRKTQREGRERKRESGWIITVCDAVCASQREREKITFRG